MAAQDQANYCVTEPNKTSTIIHWQNLFIRQKSILIRFQLVINWREQVGIKRLKNPKIFIDYLQTIDDVYENLEDYNPTKKKNVVSV